MLTLSAQAVRLVEVLGQGSVPLVAPGSAVEMGPALVAALEREPVPGVALALAALRDAEQDEAPDLELAPEGVLGLVVETEPVPAALWVQALIVALEREPAPTVALALVVLAHWDRCLAYGTSP
ncbi:MAG TPA: hypothetical protein VFV38_08510 [Ktedonobacteraceae bacterium]|nr:hypothetical protein [Ktedonobacteraceae bacterium]